MELCAEDFKRVLALDESGQEMRQDPPSDGWQPSRARSSCDGVRCKVRVHAQDMAGG